MSQELHKKAVGIIEQIEKASAESLLASKRVFKKDSGILTIPATMQLLNISDVDPAYRPVYTNEAVRELLITKLVEVLQFKTKQEKSLGAEEGAKAGNARLQELITKKIPYFAVDDKTKGWFLSEDLLEELSIPTKAAMAIGARPIAELAVGIDGMPPSISATRTAAIKAVHGEIGRYSNDKKLGWDLQRQYLEASKFLFRAHDNSTVCATTNLIEGTKNKDGTWDFRPLEEILHNRFPAYQALIEKGWKKVSDVLDDKAGDLRCDPSIPSKLATGLSKALRDTKLEPSDYVQKVKEPESKQFSWLASPEAIEGFENNGRRVHGLEEKIEKIIAKENKKNEPELTATVAATLTEKIRDK